MSEGINWDNISIKGPYLKSRKKACHDCAIATGFYSICLDDLMLQPRDVQLEQGKRWFCHNDRTRMCKGVEDRLNEKT